MDDQTLRVVLWGSGIIVAFAWAVIQLAICALCKIVWTKVAKNSDRIDTMQSQITADLNALRLDVKEHHPTKPEFEAFEARMTSMVGQIKIDLSKQMSDGFISVSTRHEHFRKDIQTLFTTKQNIVPTPTSPQQ